MNKTSLEKNPFTNQSASNAYKSVDPIYEMSAKFVLEFVNPKEFPQNARIMDIGAGTGIASEKIVDTGVGRLTLLEPSPAMLEQAKNKLSTKADYIESSIENIIVADLEPFDLVYALNCFHLFQDLSKALANIACLLKPSAVFVFNISSPTYSFDKMSETEKFIIQKNLEFYQELNKLVSSPIVAHTVELLQKILEGNSLVTFTKNKIQSLFNSVDLELANYTEVVIKIHNEYQKNIWRMIGTAFSTDSNAIEQIITKINLPDEVEIRQAIFKFSNSYK
jgi:ubiquinone/menaquinone biosynthesis C-methylase UbiE